MGNVGVAAATAFGFVAVGLESHRSSPNAEVALRGEGGHGRDGGQLCDVGGHRLGSQWAQRGHEGHGGHWCERCHWCH